MLFSKHNRMNSGYRFVTIKFYKLGLFTYCCMAPMAVQSEYNRSGFISISQLVNLRNQHLFQPEYSVLVANPAIRRYCKITSRSGFSKFFTKPLVLEVFAFKNNAGVEIFTSRGNAVNDGNEGFGGVSFYAAGLLC